MHTAVSLGFILPERAVGFNKKCYRAWNEREKEMAKACVLAGGDSSASSCADPQSPGKAERCWLGKCCWDIVWCCCLWLWGRNRLFISRSQGFLTLEPKSNNIMDQSHY